QWGSPIGAHNQKQESQIHIRIENHTQESVQAKRWHTGPRRPLTEQPPLLGLIPITYICKIERDRSRIDIDDLFKKQAESRTCAGRKVLPKALRARELTGLQRAHNKLKEKM